MKTATILSICLFLYTISFGQTQIKKNTATVEQAEGMYVFLQSSPQAEYEVLGTVKKTGLVWSGKPKEMYRILLRRAKKDFPNCDGIIFEDIDMEHATCIKFKPN